MQCFFSGTDQDQLADGSEKLMYFVSLIVNNEGSWCARIGWVEEQNEISYGSGNHLTTIPLEEPIQRFYYSDLKIVKTKPTPVTDPKALRLLQIRDAKLETAKKKTAEAQKVSTVQRNARPHNAQLSIDDLMIFDVDLTDPDGYHDAITDMVSQVFIRYVIGNIPANMTVEKVLQLPTKTMWKQLNSEKNLRSLIMALENIAEEGAGIDIFHEIMDSIKTSRSKEMAMSLTMLENKLTNGN